MIMKGILKKAVIAALAAVFVLTLSANDTSAAAKHNVTFIYGNKSVTVQVNHGANAPIPTDTAVDGYTFTSWIGSAANVTEDRVILGAYVKNPYSVVQCAPVSNTPIVPVTCTPVVKTEQVAVSAVHTPICAPVAVQPEWTIKLNSSKSAPWPEWWGKLNIPKGEPGKTCAVHWYNAWTGELWKTDIVPYGSSIATPPNPCIAGYDFAGWEGDWTNVTEDRCIRACYYEKHKVEFIDGLKDSYIDYVWVRDGEDAWVDPPHHDGYRFKHWERGDGGEYTGNVHYDMKVYAIYEKKDKD